MRRIKTFAARNRALSAAANAQFQDLLSQWGLDPQEIIEPARIFARQAPCIVEIGCGNGATLVHLAQQYPDYDFIGIEVYISGVLALLKQVSRLNLTNVRLVNYDALLVLRNCFMPASIAGLNILFPDPWPKQRHHKRRLVSASNLALFSNLLKPGGFMHFASDNAEYAQEVVRLANLELSMSSCSVTIDSEQLWRPITTKFAGKAQAAGRSIWDLTCYKL